MSATLVDGGGGPAVRLERHLPDPPQVVWRALTEADGLAGWFPCRIVLEDGVWRVGARIEFPFPADVIDLTLTGEVLVVDEPHRLAYTWGGDTLRFELHHEDGGTRLVLVDELPPSAAARNAAGWDDCLDRLAGREPPVGAWRTSFDAYASAFEPTLGAQDGPPAGHKGS